MGQSALACCDADERTCCIVVLLRRTGVLLMQARHALCNCACLLSCRVVLQVPLEDDQIFLHIGELQYVAARQQGKSAAQAYYLPSKVCILGAGVS